VLGIYEAGVEKMLSSDGHTLKAGQLNWELKAGLPSKMELAQVMYLVNEWFYYG